MILFNIIKRDGKVLFDTFCKEEASIPERGWIRFRKPWTEQGVWGPPYVIYKGNRVYTDLEFQNKIKSGEIVL